MGDMIDWMENKQSEYTIISGRKRLDDQFGWQCYCGNNDLMTRQESKTFSNPASPKPQEISDIVNNLVVDKPKFEMAEV